ncbi:MAG: hypothetical protein C1O27_001797 [Chloroflexi bacterium]|jgi:hypothetical protein|nr:MAG: hypothetical protein C1O27_001797 [Chloroflexota bacterium]
MADSTKVIPHADLETTPYWEAAREHKLKLPKCSQDGTFVFPPRPICPKCHSDKLEWTELSGRGAVYTFTIMHDKMVAGFDPPYVVAQVELEEQAGLRLQSNILECPVPDVYIGMPVEVTFEDRSEEISVPQFRPRSS